MDRIAYKPHGYQNIITQHICELRRGNRFAGMGMGKTVATLTAIDACNLADGTVPTLVLAPDRVARSVWPREALKWKHLEGISVSPIVGSAAARRQALKADANVWTINYNNIPWLIEEYADKKWPFPRIIADESTRLKNFRTRGGGGVRTTALARVAHQYVAWWSNQTGTPVPNGMKDMWGPQWFIDRGQRLGKSYKDFSMRWFHRAYDGYNIVPTDFAQEQIQDQIRDCSVALDPKDWFDVSDPIVRRVDVELPGAARDVYRRMEREMYALLQKDLQGDREVFAVNAAARTSKCLQIANGAVYYEEKATKWHHLHDEKLEALESIAEEANGMPLLVAYQWRSDAERILKAFPKARILDANPKTEDEWNAGKIPMLLAHPASAGHGLNLQDGSNILAVFGQWWDLELYQQIIERIGPVRQLQSGHNRNVWVYLIIARDTMDEDVMVRRETKRSVQDILIENLKRRQQ